MNEVKWIKITTRMFEDEKIDFIESLPEADAILIIWIKLLTQAGKNNVDGFIFLTESIPYTDEMLAHKFRRPLNTVKLAMTTLKELGMIEYDDKGFLKISNWEKHQNIEGLDKIREQARLRQQKYRKNQKLLADDNDGVTSQVTSRNALEEEEELEIDIEIDKEIDRDKDLEKENVPFIEIINYLNKKCNTKYRDTTKQTRERISARWSEGYKLGDFYRVIDIKAKEWLNDPKMATFLRPETLFGTKFESYLNQPQVLTNQEKQLLKLKQMRENREPEYELLGGGDDN